MRRAALLFVVAGGVAAFTPTYTPTLRCARPSVCHVHMGKDAADGLFSPIVKAAKVVLELAGVLGLTAARRRVTAA